MLQSRPLITSSFPGVTIHPDLPVSKRTIRKVDLPRSLTIPITSQSHTISPESPRIENNSPQDTIPMVSSTPSSIYSSPITLSPAKTNPLTSPSPCNHVPLRNRLSVRIAESSPLAPKVSAVTPSIELRNVSNTLASQLHVQTPTTAPFRPGSSRPGRRKRHRKPNPKQTPSLLGPPNLMSIPIAFPDTSRLYNQLTNVETRPFIPYVNHSQPLPDLVKLLPLLALMRTVL